MIINVRLEVDDDIRNLLACYKAGKKIKRLATRNEVLEEVVGLWTNHIVEVLDGEPKSPPVQLASPSKGDPDIATASEEFLNLNIRRIGKRDLSDFPNIEAKRSYLRAFSKTFSVSK